MAGAVKSYAVPNPYEGQINKRFTPDGISPFSGIEIYPAFSISCFVAKLLQLLKGDDALEAHNQWILIYITFL